MDATASDYPPGDQTVSGAAGDHALSGLSDRSDRIPAGAPGQAHRPSIDPPCKIHELTTTPA